MDASHGNSKSSLGGVFRDNYGRWIVGFTKNIEAMGSLEAELKAIKEGLKIAHEWNLFPLQIESDCAEAIKAILHGNKSFDNIISYCRLLMHQRKVTLLQHTFRECNKVSTRGLKWEEVQK